MLVSTVLLGQGKDWPELVASWRRSNHAPATLLVPKERLTPAFSRSDESLLLMTSIGDLAVQSLEGAMLAGLSESRGWKPGSHWFLLGKDGTLLDEGTDLPKGDYLQGRLAAAGIASTWEALEQFIRLQPENGPALQKRLSIALRLARRRLLNLREQGKVGAPKFVMEFGFPVVEPAKLIDQTLPDAWCGEVEDTLKLLNQLPDPWRMGDKMTFQVWLDFYGRATSLGVRGELARLRDAILEAWKQTPDSGRDWKQTQEDEGLSTGLGGFWMSCDLASRRDDGLPELPLLTPAPGRFWPGLPLLMTLPWSSSESGNARGILAFLDRLPADRDMPTLWYDAWPEWLRFRSFVSFRRATALGNLGRWQEAALALQECRRLSGKQWTETAASLSSLFRKGEPPDPPGKAEAPVPMRPPEVFLEVLRWPNLEELPPPQPPLPFRFLVWGQPDWAKHWDVLRASAALAPWDTAELRRDAPTDSDSTRLALAGFQASGWAVFQGDSTIVTRGDSAPDPAKLALQLRSAAPARIQVLDHFIAQHPEHLDARRDRFALVRSRMPQPALESRLFEDAARIQGSLEFGPDAPWISDLEGWRNQARKVVPELESRLRRWPDHAGLWRAWVSWSAFLEKPPSVVAFAGRLPVFGPREDWTAQLPSQVHRAVAKECRQSRKFELMADWFEGAWRNLVARMRWADSPEMGDQEKAIHDGYREALTALGRKEERQELDRAWALFQPKGKAVPKP